MLLTLLAVLAGLAVVVALLLLWMHRSTLASFVPGVPFYDHHPYFGIMPVEVRNIPRYYDWKLSQAERAQSEGHEILQRVAPFLSALEVHSPRMLQYILKDNFDNFESQCRSGKRTAADAVGQLHIRAPRLMLGLRLLPLTISVSARCPVAVMYAEGDRFRGAFHVFLGDGIFNSDFEPWRRQRKLASHMFSAAKLNHCMLEAFVERSGTVLELLDQQLDAQRKAAASGQTVPYLDFQSLMNSYNMDSIMQIGFGLQLDSMRSATPPPFVSAFDDMQETIMHRLMGPAFVYRFQRLFGLGRETQLARSLPIIDEFVFGVVKTRKENAEQFVDSGDLLSLFVADAAKTAAKGGDTTGEPPLSDRELRDIVLNFMIVRFTPNATALPCAASARAFSPHSIHSTIGSHSSLFSCFLFAVSAVVPISGRARHDRSTPDLAVLRAVAASRGGAARRRRDRRGVRRHSCDGAQRRGSSCGAGCGHLQHHSGEPAPPGISRGRHPGDAASAPVHPDQQQSERARMHVPRWNARTRRKDRVVLAIHLRANGEHLG
jgi:hypothetical protein